MKKLLSFLLLFVISLHSYSQQFFDSVTYRGAFAPAPQAMWTGAWVNWDPQNANYPAPTDFVTSDITVNTTWTTGKVYLLQGPIFITNNAELTIQPGVIVLGEKAANGAGLFVTRGAKLYAIGTEQSPVVFSSDQAAGQRNIGDWGGVILMGNAHVNQAGGTAYVEGFANTANTQYGGGATPNDNDNSGSLQYVRIEFGGYIYQPNKEINGLTLGGVGAGTTLDHIQVSYTNDDAFEWFGGAVNARHLVSYRNLDDDFDTDFGYSGNVQFGLVVRDPNIADNPSVSTSEGFESDNDASGSTASPFTSAIFSNITLIGPYRGNTASTIASGYRRGARIRRNSKLNICNSLFLDFQRGVHIDGAACEANALAGDIHFMNNIVAGCVTGKTCEVNAGSTFDIWSWFGAHGNDSLTTTTGLLINPYNFLSPDYRPDSVSMSHAGAAFTDSIFTGKMLEFALGTENLNSEMQGFTVYPNPSSNLIYCAGMNAHTTYTISLYSITGEKVMVSNTTPLDISNIPSGVYLVEMTGNGQRAIRKVVKY
jgi:hypothetical protein